MSSNNYLTSFYVRIDSLEDIQRAFIYNNNNPSHVSKILNLHGFTENFDEFNKEIEGLFKKAYCKSLGTDSNLAVMQIVTDCENLLKHSIKVCKKTLRPFVISSFKAQQIAIERYAAQQQESATSAIADTKKIAANIASECENLSHAFLSLRHKTVEQTVLLTRYQCLLQDKLWEIQERQLQEKQKGEDVRLPSYRLTDGIQALEEAKNSLWKIQTTLLNVSSFLTNIKRCSELLNNSMLDDLEYVQVVDLEMADVDSSKNDEGFIIEAARAIELLSETHSQKKVALEDVFKNMKTAKTIAILNPSVTMADLLMSPSGNFGTIESEFEELYLNWLGLAKVNEQIATLMKEMLIQVKKSHEYILETEKNPKIKALRSMSAKISDN